jgi:F-type H+-transporting ATPase subunit delta
MKIDRKSRFLAKKYFVAAQGPSGAVDEARARAAVQAIVDDKPRNYVAVLTYFSRLIALALEERTVRIESATPLPDEGAAVFADLERQYGPASRTFYVTNPALLGGLKIRRGNNIWDGSVSGRLSRLQQALS